MTDSVAHACGFTLLMLSIAICESRGLRLLKVEFHIAFGRLGDAREDLEQSALPPRCVRSSHHLAALDFERHVF
jgi:hypothetical protein